MSWPRWAAASEGEKIKKFLLHFFINSEGTSFTGLLYPELIQGFI
jgi:hypothetical protein